MKVFNFKMDHYTIDHMCNKSLCLIDKKTNEKVYIYRRVLNTLLKTAEKDRLCTALAIPSISTNGTTEDRKWIAIFNAF